MTAQPDDGDRDTAPVASGEPAIAVVGVRKAFVASAGPVVVLDGVDLVVEPGELVAIAGRSGSGKTTLLTIVAGWEPPDAGVVRLAGTTLTGPVPWADCALLPQTLGLLDELTLAENVGLPGRLGTATRTGPSVADVLDRLGVGHLADRYPTEVSLGEQQRAALARALVARPALVLADEPVAHQNREWATSMVTALRELVDGGSTCLLATHDAVAFSGADRVLEVHDGRVRPQTGAHPVRGV